MGEEGRAEIGMWVPLSVMRVDISLRIGRVAGLALEVV